MYISCICANIRKIAIRCPRRRFKFWLQCRLFCSFNPNGAGLLFAHMPFRATNQPGRARRAGRSAMPGGPSQVQPAVAAQALSARTATAGCIALKAPWQQGDRPGRPHSAEAEHALDGLHGLAGHGGVHLYGGPLVLQRVVQLQQCVHLHVLALVASPGLASG